MLKQKGVKQGLDVFRVSCEYYSANTAYWSLHRRYSYQKDERPKSGNAETGQCTCGFGKLWDSVTVAVTGCVVSPSARNTE